jgi:hypothetical protein
LHQRAVAGFAEGLEIGDLGRVSDGVPELRAGERRIAQAFERTDEDVAEVAPLILDLPPVLARQNLPRASSAAVAASARATSSFRPASAASLRPVERPGVLAAPRARVRPPLTPSRPCENVQP